VDSRTTSQVATTIAGLVVEYPGREGVRVKKGDVLAQLRQKTRELSLQSTEGQLGEAQARLDQAETNLDRAKDLFESKVISQQRYDDAMFEVNAWQGKVAQLTADRARLEDEVERSIIRAPFSGVVVQEMTEIGQWVKQGDQVVELLSTSNLEVIVDAPERYFRLIKPGTKARVRFGSLPGLEISGTVSAVIPRADSAARTFPLKVRISNRRGRIGVGMLAQVSFLAGEAYKATIVPKDAVVTQGPNRMVYLLNGDGTVDPVSVQTGEGAGDWIAVEGPVQPGQKVITRGNERLRPGQPVQAEALSYKLP
jgi:RND family efflux transporter MFP subunit